MTMVTSQQVIKQTRTSFAPPTKKQKEQQAQARARGGLTSRGISRFESSSPSEQKAIVAKERAKVGLEPKVDPKPIIQKVSPISRAPRPTEAKQFRARADSTAFLTSGGTFKPVSEQPTDVSGRRVTSKDTEALRFEQRQPQVREAKFIGVKEGKTLLQKIETLQKKQREEIKLKPTIAGQVRGAAIGLTASLISTGVFAKELLTDPKGTITEVGKGLKQFAKDPLPVIKSGLKIVKEEPGFAVGFVAGEVVAAKGTAQIPRAARVARTVTSPKFKPVLGGEVRVITTKGPKEFKVVGAFESFAQPVKEQVKFAGKTVDAVSAQRSLLSPFKRKITVDKPLPTPDAPPLEKAFFADPEARLRPSRLGLTEKPSIREGISFSLKREKPQALIFPDTPVAKLPKSLFDVEKSLKTGKTLTPSQSKRLEKFQLTPTGEFKPVGFISREPEITLAPGEIIKREKKLGATIIKGERVELIEARIGKASPELRKMLGKTPTRKSIRQLEKESGLGISRPRKGVTVTPSKAVSRAPRLKGLISRAPKGLPRRPSPTPSKKVSPISKVSLPPSRPTPSSPTARPPIRPPVTPSLPPRIPRVPKSPPVRPPIRAAPPSRPTPSIRPPRFPKIPPFRPPKKIRFKMGEDLIRVSKRQVKIQTQFTPSLVAAERKIKGKRPSLLTGLKIRPIQVKT